MDAVSPPSRPASRPAVSPAASAVTSKRRRNQRGTSTLELMGMAPLVVLLSLILIQAAVSLYGVTTAQTAARQGARAYSLGDDPQGVVRDSVPGWMGVTMDTVGSRGHGVEVHVDVPDVIPGFNLVITRKTVMP